MHADACSKSHVVLFMMGSRGKVTEEEPLSTGTSSEGALDEMRCYCVEKDCSGLLK